jgi:DNA replication protein DnaC
MNDARQRAVFKTTRAITSTRCYAVSIPMACARCDDTGWRPVDRDGVRRVERCECWVEALSGRLLQEARIPARYARATLQNFVIYPNDELVDAVAQAQRFVAAFPAVDKGLCLVGPAGIGKTHIAVAVLRQIVMEKLVRGMFCDVPDLLRVIRSTYNPSVRAAEMDILRPVMEAELLVLDDLGKEKPSEWVEETMNLIVGTRYNKRLPTIFTTNHEDSSDETNLDSLKVRVGFRMHSRLHEMCEFLEYFGADYRELPPNGGVEDLVTLWKKAPRRKTLPARSAGPIRAQLSESRARQEMEDRKRDPRELKWPGGKAGSQ